MADSGFSSIAELVPQVSYEIVGRIIPGIVVILSLVAAAKGPTQALIAIDSAFIHPQFGLSGWGVVLIILAAYSLAFVLDGVWHLSACVRRRDQEQLQTDLRSPSKSFKFDVVNQKLPKAGAWLTKLYAETNATKVLIIGWMGSAAVNIYFLVTDLHVERVWLEAGLIAGTIAVVAVRRSITRTHEQSLENLWVILQEPISVEQAENTECEGKKG